MRGFITSVNDNHVNNYIKENLAFVYYGSMETLDPKQITRLIINVRKHI